MPANDLAVQNILASVQGLAPAQAADRLRRSLNAVPVQDAAAREAYDQALRQLSGAGLDRGIVKARRRPAPEIHARPAPAAPAKSAPPPDTAPAAATLATAATPSADEDSASSGPATPVETVATPTPAPADEAPEA